MDKILLMNLAGYANAVRHHLNKLNEKMEWLYKNLPMDKDLKGNCKVVYDHHGEIFLYFDGVYYSFEIIKSIVKAHGELTRERLYASGIDE